MTVQFRVVDHQEIEPFARDLHDIEQTILYPLNGTDDHFAICHGERYQPFFCRMGKTRFVLALDRGRVCGIMAGVWKKVRINGRVYTGLYLADLKLSKPYRGQKIIQRMIWFSLKKWLSSSEYRGWDFAFSAAMQGQSGDVTRSFSGLHPGRLLKAAGALHIYFCPPQQLAALGDSGPVYPPLDSVACLSLTDVRIQDNTGLKEFRLQSTGQPWPLIHLPAPVSCWSQGLGDYLRQCGNELLLSASTCQPSAIACFALDSRLTSHRQWLSINGIQPGATCAIYGFPATFIGHSPISRADYIHLSTSEI